MDNGIINIGIDYYTDLVREHAIMQEQQSVLRRLLEKEYKKSKIVYAEEIAQVFGFKLEDMSGYQE